MISDIVSSFTLQKITMENNTVVFHVLDENNEEVLWIAPKELYSETVWSKIKQAIRLLFTNLTPKDWYNLGGLDDDELEERISNELDDNIKTFYPN